MKSLDLEQLFKESIEEEETLWIHHSQLKLQTEIVNDNKKWTQIFFSEIETPNHETPSETSHSLILKKLLAVALWVSGTVILFWTIRDLLSL